MKLINFNQKPTLIEPYEFGQDVNRENCVNFLILSYGVSRGNFVIQKVFFVMNEKKFDFPYKQVIKDFYENGGYDTFTEEEQQIFQKAFRGVSAHMEKYIEMEIEDEIRDEINGLCDRPEREGELVFNSALNFFNFDAINSVLEFNKTAKEFNEKFESSLN